MHLKCLYRLKIPPKRDNSSHLATLVACVAFVTVTPLYSHHAWNIISFVPAYFCFLALLFLSIKFLYLHYAKINSLICFLQLQWSSLLVFLFYNFFTSRFINKCLKVCWKFVLLFILSSFVMNILFLVTSDNIAVSCLVVSSE
jgi:hypothetical protein